MKKIAKKNGSAKLKAAWQARQKQFERYEESQNRMTSEIDRAKALRQVSELVELYRKRNPSRRAGQYDAGQSEGIIKMHSLFSKWAYKGQK